MAFPLRGHKVFWRKFASAGGKIPRPASISAYEYRFLEYGLKKGKQGGSVLEKVLQLIQQKKGHDAGEKVSGIKRHIVVDTMGRLTP